MQGRTPSPALPVLLLAVVATLCSAVLLAPARVAAEEDPEAEKRVLAEYIRSHYTKFEHRIPMRDGIELFTAAYVPIDASGQYPFLIKRTPYSVGPYGADRYAESLGPHSGFAEEGFIFVYQDVRGKYMSEGEYVNMRPHRPNKSGTEVDESSDTWDTIAWLLENVDGHNGKAGALGDFLSRFL